MEPGKLTVGERAADIMAGSMSTWAFLIGFSLTMQVYICLNGWLLPHLGIRPFDPYPFSFFNLILSCLAAIQAPVIMMSQKRQEANARSTQLDILSNAKASYLILAILQKHLEEKAEDRE